MNDRGVELTSWDSVYVAALLCECVYKIAESGSGDAFLDAVRHTLAQAGVLPGDSLDGKTLRVLPSRRDVLQPYVLAECSAVPELVFCCFMGTKTIADVRVNVDIGVRGRRHTLLWRRALGVLPTIRTLRQYHCALGGRQLILCGHSLGGMLAQLVVLLLGKEAQADVGLLTFGSPGVLGLVDIDGQGDSFRDLGACGIPRINVVSRNDLVVRGAQVVLDGVSERGGRGGEGGFAGGNGGGVRWWPPPFGSSGVGCGVGDQAATPGLVSACRPGTPGQPNLVEESTRNPKPMNRNHAKDDLSVKNNDDQRSYVGQLLEVDLPSSSALGWLHGVHGHGMHGYRRLAELCRARAREETGKWESSATTSMNQPNPVSVVRGDQGLVPLVSVRRVDVPVGDGLKNTSSSDVFALGKWIGMGRWTGVDWHLQAAIYEDDFQAGVRRFPFRPLHGSKL